MRRKEVAAAATKETTETTLLGFINDRQAGYATLPMDASSARLADAAPK
jgi:hypothetical protein